MSRFVVGDGYASYSGPAVEASLHSHAAFQIAIAQGGEVAISDEREVTHRGTALVVSPMTKHRMEAGGELRLFFVEPQHAFSDHLRRRWGRGISSAGELEDLVDEDIRFAPEPGSLDPRLLEAMGLVTVPGTTIGEIASRVGVSPHRLRALARDQLGMSLPRWRAWQRLRLAADSLAAGTSLAEAAIDGGFADQAHLNRWMREMMGVTPRTAAIALRPQTAAT